MRNVRIVVADEREVNFFDASKADGPLTPCGSLRNEAAGLKDIDLETDRAGRRYGGASGVRHGSGPTQGHHHGVDGERSTERHELTLFAKQAAERIDKDRINHEFDKLVIVAPPRMLGLLRQSLSGPAQAMLAGEISKDVVHQGQDAIRNVVPREAFSQLQ
jgi:protein required for attachment to host cells